MSEHGITLEWSRDGHEFRHETFSRAHRVQFAGGQSVRASSAPDFLGDAALANPEELLVAAVSSCHMLTFLAIAAKRGIQVDSYEDDAVGTLGKDDEGRLAMTRVVLRPRISFGGDKVPDGSGLQQLHEKAHQHCLIASSLRTEVLVES